MKEGVEGGGGGGRPEYLELQVRRASGIGLKGGTSIL